MSIALVGLLLLSLPVVAITLRSHLHKKYPVSGSLISSFGTVDWPLAPKGSVIIDGELWLARSANGATIPAQTSIKVVGFDDHHLLVTQAVKTNSRTGTFSRHFHFVAQKMLNN